MMVCLSLEQWEQVKRLSRFAGYYIDDMEPSNSAYKSDKEDIDEAQQSIRDVDRAQYQHIIRNMERSKNEAA